MIHVCTSHRTEVLVDAFVERLVDERKRASLFAPVRVVVPNRNVETYLRLKIAERCGIAANLETTFLRKFLAGIVESKLPGARVADVAHVQGELLALLHDDGLLAQTSLAHLRAYLAASGTDRDALDRRRCQLAEILAQLFDEYAGSRPELLAAWARNEKDGSGAVDPDLEVWQRSLWYAIFGKGGRLARKTSTSGLRYQPLDALWAEAMEKKPVPFAGQTLHVFGLSYIATAYHRMLATLAQKSTLYVYTLNPCREDELTEGQTLAKPDLTSEDPFGLARESQPLLRRWARPGRENLRLLAVCPGATVEARFPASAAASATLLGRLQSDIVNRRTPSKAAPSDNADVSLRVLPCPSLRRELEVVAAEIWNLVRGDASLRLCDVAVIVPEKSKELYLAQLSAVFGESCQLPHNVADLPAASAHPVVEAIELLLELPFSSFTRKDFLPLVTHPCLMARFPKARPATWRELTDRLGIVRGADRGDFAGSYVTRDLFTWEQGLRRLSLGAFIDASGPDHGEPVLLDGEPTLPGPFIDSADEECLGFGLLVRSLLADAHFATGGKRTPERPLGAWLEFIRGMVRSYLVLGETDGAGRAVVAHFLAELESLSEIGIAAWGTDEVGLQPVSYRVAAELAKRALGAVPWSRGHYLASGVTVASFVPMRAIPFRAVFVLGLGQDAFPRAAGRPELDLRSGARQAGDVDRREQDLYMFLETLLSAREQVTLSYVARDEITGDELPCSSVLLELRTVLARGYLDASQLALLFGDDFRARPRLRRYDDIAERRAVLPAAESEHRAKQLGAALAQGKPTVGSSEASESNKKTASPPTAAPRNKIARPGPLIIPLSALRRFLEDPLQGSARFRLGMHDGDDRAPADLEDEPFDIDKRGLSSLLRASMTEAIVSAQATPEWPTLLATYERQAIRAELAGQCPTGLFRSVGLQFEKALLQGWHQELPGIFGQGCAACRAIRLAPDAGQGRGQDTRSDPGVEYRPAPSFPALLRETADGTVPDLRQSFRQNLRIDGKTGLLAHFAGASSTTLRFTCRAGVKGTGVCREDLLAFLDYVVLTATAAEPARSGHRSAVFHVKGTEGKLRVLEFGPLERARAQDYLARLSVDLLTGALDVEGAGTGVHPYLLPHEAVLASRRNHRPLLDEIKDLCSAERSRVPSFSSLQGPVPRVLARYAPPAEKEAEHMVEERFGLFFALAREERS